MRYSRSRTWRSRCISITCVDDPDDGVHAQLRRRPRGGYLAVAGEPEEVPRVRGVGLVQGVRDHGYHAGEL